MFQLDLTRRGLFYALTGGALRATDAPAHRTAVDDLLLKFGPWRTTGRAERRFRVEATVLFLGMPVVSRSDAGGAIASVEHLEAKNGFKATRFRFGAGSWPERVKGINRYGWMEEVVIYSDGQPHQAAWFGAMTSITEDNFIQAKGAGDKDSRGETKITTTQGNATYGHSVGQRLRVRLAGRPCWRQHEDVRTRLMSAWSNSDLKRESLGGQRNEAPAQFFLSGIWAEMQDCKGKSMFWHNAEAFQLTTERSGEQLTGKIQSLKDHDHSSFQLVIPPGEVLPSRIDYQAKSFLRLTLVEERQTNQNLAAL